MQFMISKSISYISIHTLRVEGDLTEEDNLICILAFQSTPSAWRVTLRRFPLNNYDVIFQSTPSAWRVTAKAHKKAARFCSK